MLSGEKRKRALQSRVSFSPTDGWLPQMTGAYVLLLEREKHPEFVPRPGRLTSSTGARSEKPALVGLPEKEIAWE